MRFSEEICNVLGCNNKVGEFSDRGKIPKRCKKHRKQFARIRDTKIYFLEFFGYEKAENDGFVYKNNETFFYKNIDFAHFEEAEKLESNASDTDSRTRNNPSDLIGKYADSPNEYSYLYNVILEELAKCWPIPSNLHKIIDDKNLTKKEKEAGIAELGEHYRNEYKNWKEKNKFYNWRIYE